MNYLLHSLYQHARTTPDKDIYIQLDRNANTFRRISFKALFRQVCGMSSNLSALIDEHDRVLLLYENAFDFIPVFLACMQRGCVPAAIQIPNNTSKINRIRNLLETEQVKAVILPDTLNDKGWFRQLMSEADDINSMLLPIPSIWGGEELSHYPEPDPIVGHRIIYGQLSSGTTGKSKWINITSDNVKANTDAIGLSIRQRPEWNHLCWLPHYHDLGLVAGLFLSICHGNTTWLIDPLDFVSRPQVWPEAMSRYCIHFTHAPNFALDLCVRRIGHGQLSADVNLSTITSIMVCAEPIRASSLEKFYTLLQPYGLGPTPFVTCFGMAECTLAATMQTQGTAYKVIYHPALEKNFVSCGIPIDGISVCIQPVKGQPEGVGEIVLKGPSISPDHTETGLHTGDLGFMNDGELYICGRLKEVIILNGVKHLLYEIEKTLESLPFVHERGALAVVNTSGEGESLTIFVELKREFLHKNLRNEQLSSITRQLNGEYGISRGEIRFFPPASLPKTSSGKKSRSDYSFIDSETSPKRLT
jgi:acyl-CoA synthetase (AMP-forming)/AMP-acid ligase II